MSNVIPLKRPEHVISDNERRELVNALTDIARKYHDFGCLREVISKCVDDALKRDNRDGETNIPSA